MKTETIQNRSTLRPLVIVTLITLAFAAAANAQSAFTGRFTLPYEVQWGKVVLPAGDYSITIDSSAAPAIVRSATGETKMFTAVPIRGESVKGEALLLIAVRGNEHRVLSLNAPRLGASLIYEPFANTERDLRANAGQVQTVPVIIAGAGSSDPARRH